MGCTRRSPPRWDDQQYPARCSAQAGDLWCPAAIRPQLGPPRVMLARRSYLKVESGGCICSLTSSALPPAAAESMSSSIRSQDFLSQKSHVSSMPMERWNRWRARLAQNRYMSRPQRAAPSDVARLDQRRRGPHASPGTLRARPPLAHAPTCSPHLRRPRRSARATPVAEQSRWQDTEEHTRVGTQPSAVGKREGRRTGPRRAVWSGKTCSIPSAEPTCEQPTALELSILALLQRSVGHAYHHVLRVRAGDARENLRCAQPQPLTLPVLIICTSSRKVSAAAP